MTRYNKNVVLYIHGKGGSAAESEHYQPLFSDCKVIGLNYQTFTPWETGKEIRIAVEELTGEWLRYVKSHPVKWNVPTRILYGSNDHLTSPDTITDFAKKHQATLTIMEGGEHWFHTGEQMMFLDNWIKKIK